MQYSEQHHNYVDSLLNKFIESDDPKYFLVWLQYKHEINEED